MVFRGWLQPWVSGKDIVLELLRRWGTPQSQRMSLEFVDADGQLPVTYRNTIANMMAEGEALNGIFAPDDLTRAWFHARGRRNLPYPVFGPGTDAVYDIDETLELSRVVPLVARPYSPGNAFAAAEMVARGEADRGVLICGSGIGMCMAANKVSGIRAALCRVWLFWTQMLGKVFSGPHRV